MTRHDHERRDYTLVDCGCQTKAHRDGSGTEIYFCPLHRAAPELAAALHTIAYEPIGPAEASAREVLAAVVIIARVALANATATDGPTPEETP